MAMITSIRAPVPVAEAAPLPVPLETRRQAGAAGPGAAPVAKTTLASAAQQPAQKTHMGGTDLMTAGMTAESSAAAAAEAARAAYIKASIAAGISPLPLP